MLLVTSFMAGCHKDEASSPTIPVTEVRLDKNTLTLHIGETSQLTATVLPDNADDKTVVWSSDNKQVATVSESGLVTAVSDGEATVTATAGGKKTTCTVTVTDPENITADFDPEFARVLEEKGYIPNAAHITLTDVKDIEKIDVAYISPSNRNPLTSLKGIEYFTALTSLYCIYNQLTSLDVSNNTALTALYCYDNRLTSLDISNNTALTYLSCPNNQLTFLDVSKNTALTALYCENNPGDGMVFPVTAWFGNDAVPENFTTGTWRYNGQPVTTVYRKAN